MALTLDWDNWLYGIGAGFIGGGATSISGGLAAMAVDHNDINMFGWKFYAIIGLAFLGNGVLSMFIYLAQHPMPDKIVTHTTVETTEEHPPVKTVTTVEETRTTTAPPETEEKGEKKS